MDKTECSKEGDHPYSGQNSYFTTFLNNPLPPPPTIFSIYLGHLCWPRTKTTLNMDCINTKAKATNQSYFTTNPTCCISSNSGLYLPQAEDSRPSLEAGFYQSLAFTSNSLCFSTFAHTKAGSSFIVRSAHILWTKHSIRAKHERSTVDLFFSLQQAINWGRFYVLVSPTPRMRPDF